MADILWSHRAERAAFRLPVSARTELLRTLALLRESPEMGALVREGRYRGYRRVFVKPYWYVYYRVAGAERDCHIGDIRDARRRPV